MSIFSPPSVPEKLKYTFTAFGSIDKSDTIFCVKKSTGEDFLVKKLKAHETRLKNADVKTDAQLDQCTVVKTLVVGRNLHANFCDLKAICVNGQANAFNCYAEKVIAKELKAYESYLKNVNVKTDVQLDQCTVEGLIVEGNLHASSCVFGRIEVKGKTDLFNCYADDVIVSSDMKFINGGNMTKVFKRTTAQESTIGNLTFGSGHIYIDNCKISVIHITKEGAENDPILEFRGNPEVGIIISDGVDVEIRGRRLKI